MASEADNRSAFGIQQFYCERMDAPIYAAICAALATGLTRDGRTGARVLDWPSEPTRDALPLRLIGGLHALVLGGRDDGLAAVFAGRISGPDAITAVLRRVLVQHDALLLRWLDGPPQTNEPGRSAALMTGLLEIARRHGPRIDVLEIGSSAGLNLLIGRYRFDLGGVAIGPVSAPIEIVPEWTGLPPPDVPIEIVRARGCDIAPLDATDPAVAARLSAYVWAETPARAARLRGAIGMLRERGVDLVRADAADWVETRLAEPQAMGVTRVLMHSVVWQYLPDAVAERIRVAMAAAGAVATAARPLAWVIMEPDRALGRQIVRVRSWPKHAEWTKLATAHAHGTWVEYGVSEDDGEHIVLPITAAVSPG